MLRQLGIAVLVLLPAGPASAGTFFAMEELARSGPLNPLPLNAGAVTHPVGYVGNPGLLEVRICVESTPEARPLVGPLQKALQMWNRLTPITGNCSGKCEIAEDAPLFNPGNTDAMSTLLHEVGHCGLALGHPNLRELADTPANQPSQTASGVCDVSNDGCCGEVTSYTNSANTTGDNGSGLRGSSTNDPVNECPTSGLLPIRTTQQAAGCNMVPGGFACPIPARCCPNPPPSLPILQLNLFFFRRSDDNPVVVDPLTIVDFSTYSRNPSNLPLGHNSPVSPNRLVAAELGYPNTQAVMYSLDSRARVFTGLTADDVAMVKYANAGKDRLVSAVDDYTVALRYQSSCDTAQIVVGFDPTLVGANGVCRAKLQSSYDQSGNVVVYHWSLIPSSETKIAIRLTSDPSPTDPNTTWDFGSHVFSAEGEAGDLREWDGISPP